MSFRVPGPSRETSESELNDSHDGDLLIRNSVKPVGQTYIDYDGDRSRCWKEGHRQGLSLHCR